MYHLRGRDSLLGGVMDRMRELERERLLATLLYIVYREHCCRFSDEDCDDLADLAYRQLGVELDSECEEGEAGG